MSGLVLALARVMLDVRMSPTPMADRAAAKENLISITRDVLAAAEGTGGGVRVVPLDQTLSAEETRCVRDVATRLGFVCHHPGQSISRNDRIELLHRHMFLLCANATDHTAIVSWIRELAWTSPRRHVVLWPADASAALQRVTESSAGSPAVGRIGSLQIRRAERWMSRDRPRIAERWLTAALASARRHESPADVAGIELHLSRLLVDAGRFSEASVRVWPAIKSTGLAWPLYSELAALWADIVIASGKLPEADSWLHSIQAEATVRGVALPASILDRRVRLDFWTGASTSTVSPIPSVDSSEALGWLALAAWRDGHRSALEQRARLIDGRATGPDLAARFWSALIHVLLRDVSVHADQPMTLAADLATRHQMLARAISGKVRLDDGDRQRALKVLAPSDGDEPERRLIRLLRCQAAHPTGQFNPPDAATIDPSFQCFLAGPRFPGERTSMVSVDGLGRLLQAMEDASDEFTGVGAGCAWVRRQAPDVNVGVVSADGLRIVAGCGWKTADLAGSIAAIADLGPPNSNSSDQDATRLLKGYAVPIKYGATLIARVVVGPGSRAPLLLHAARALAMLAGPSVRACLDALDLRGQERDGLQEILGRSQAVVEVRTSIARAAVTPFPVLIEGESGTGKELAARALHRLSARRDRRFLAVNCAALTDELVEAELFGHARGAFTGAVGPRAGLFEDAHGGTLFLDEVTELSARAQAKLLRVLQEREVRRVGESASRPVDVRIVAASNVPLSDAAAKGRFRDDLRFRLAVVPIRLPALRDRLEDVPLLTHVFWRRALTETGKRSYLGPDALVRLARHAWPGNIRELQNVIAGLAVSAPTCGRVTARLVSQVISQMSGAIEDRLDDVQPLDAARRIFERRLVAATMARHAGRRASAAQELGLTRQGLAKTLRRLGLAEDETTAGVA
jgi:DNA-binding NtrC family response regulator